MTRDDKIVRRSVRVSELLRGSEDCLGLRRLRDEVSCVIADFGHDNDC